MYRRISLALVAVVAALAFGACGSSGGSSSSNAKCPAKADTRAAVNGAITVCSTEFSFGVKTITAPAGPLTVTLINSGSIGHTFTIIGQSLNLVVSSHNGDKTGTVTLPKGTYTFECTVPGHAQQGMKGTLVIS
jgi:plastocyanin